MSHYLFPLTCLPHFSNKIVVLPASLLSSRSGSLRDSGSSGRVGRREPWERGWMETTLSVEQGTNLSKQKNDTKTIGLKAISSILVFNIEVSFQRERLRDPCVGRREPWERGWMETTLSVEQGTNLSKQKNDTKTIGLKAISSILVFNIEVSFQRERLRDPCVKLHSLFSRQ